MRHAVLMLVLASCLLLVGSAAAQETSPRMKMTTTIPPGIATPDTLETRIGTLHLVDGVPTAETARLLYDNLDFQRGVQAYLSSIQIASMHAMREGILKFGPANRTVLMFADLMDSHALFLTPNTTSVYNVLWLELADEPMVMETPPNVLGLINDYWFHYVCDFGNAGPDRGKGGKYLIVPPDYEGALPDGFHVVRTQTHNHWVIWRGFQQNGDTKPAVEATKKSFRLYPLSQSESQPELTFLNVSGKEFNTIHAGDYRFFEEVNEVVQAEPPEGQDPEILGLLASIGIRKGEPFKPDARMKAILEDAANVGTATARALASRPRDKKFYYYPGESYWVTPFVGGSYQFIENGARLLDARAFFHFYATGITPAMSMAAVGKGSQYAAAFLDAEGKPFDGSKTYRLHLPPGVPAKNFWSIVVYDNQTRSQLQTDQRFPSVSSARETTKQNADGSYDVYFGPTAPEGKESNWIQTIPGKGWNMLLRLYGPAQSWFDKTWRPAAPVVVD
ncbi:hypothetical protein Mal4_18080 [Maioricimonas rarisocia]|uniref:DUF1254 domain-containing protein n=1 Tax=Maioricimonas rarisocia TaxID=2528026 RepID=A0A517Z4W3_9PLAN|nr:DUF1254 domain-containing protein [Maioricimonas rarisocia]QDU37494.1 hypothetical protein Mal4_18080 [Maioricimonas rarisocia]